METQTHKMQFRSMFTFIPEDRKTSDAAEEDELKTNRGSHK